MPQTITLSDATYSLLQMLAKPFIDTPESVIASLASEEIKRRGAPAVLPNSTNEPKALILDPDRHESLTHAKLLAAAFAGTDLHRPRWNGLLDHVHIVARKRLGSLEEVQRISGANLRAGRYEDDGFHYLADADLSIQGVDSNLAWAHALGIARQLRVPIRVKFQWRLKAGAARPGEVAILEWSPPNLAIA